MALTENTHAVRLKRLRYQSWHRGCKETDVILGNYFDTHAADWDGHDIALYETFLEEDDHEIWQWIAYGQPPPNDDYIPLIGRLRAFHEYRSL